MLGFPSLVLLAIIAICWQTLAGKKQPTEVSSRPKSEWHFRRRILELAKIPQFWMVCGLSFTLTITRETFNVWTVDFLKTDGGQMTTKLAALLSTPFDAMGAVGILLLGWLLDRLSAGQRKWLLFGILSGVAVLTFQLPTFIHEKVWMAVAAIGLIGLLSYGPYSLLAGVLSLEIRGPDFVATVAGLVDASGYLAGMVSGYLFGRILDQGGYLLGFHCLGIFTMVGAVLCLGLNRPQNNSVPQVHSP